MEIPNNSYRPAYPIDGEHLNSGLNSDVAGLTKREHFAGLAMQGMLSNSIDCNQGMEPYWHMGTEGITKLAVTMDDQLLKELEK